MMDNLLGMDEELDEEMERNGFAPQRGNEMNRDDIEDIEDPEQEEEAKRMYIRSDSGSRRGGLVLHSSSSRAQPQSVPAWSPSSRLSSIAVRRVQRPQSSDSARSGDTGPSSASSASPVAAAPSSSSASSSVSVPRRVSVNAGSLSYLTEMMGFRKEAATRALLLNGNNIGLATEWVLENGSAGGANQPIDDEELRELEIHAGMVMSRRQRLRANQNDEDEDDDDEEDSEDDDEEEEGDEEDGEGEDDDEGEDDGDEEESERVEGEVKVDFEEKEVEEKERESGPQPVPNSRSPSLNSSPSRVRFGRRRLSSSDRDKIATPPLDPMPIAHGHVTRCDVFPSIF